MLVRALYVRVTRGWQGLFVQVRHKSSKGSPCQHDSCLARVSYVKVTYAKGSLCKGGMPGKGSLSKGESWLARAIYIRVTHDRGDSLVFEQKGYSEENCLMKERTSLCTRASQSAAFSSCS
ncbi:hypothetical protein J6590_029289 [Homalodisca vitripennis]|nr:hypothetical protein J6590_029289 [Homalodisca vitripennis]